MIARSSDWLVIIYLSWDEKITTKYYFMYHILKNEEIKRRNEYRVLQLVFFHKSYRFETMFWMVANGGDWRWSREDVLELNGLNSLYNICKLHQAN